ncbi:MAG: hypothetical protein ABJP87_18075 [Bauldia litoralis]|uniref:hypothetical protein n=1 Tax=Bauldia litoralis TaxID=665467 RepID=UPI0032983835
MPPRKRTQEAVPAALYIVVDIVLLGVGLAVVFLVPPMSDLPLMWIPIALMASVALTVPVAWTIWTLTRPKPVAPPARPAPPPIPTRLPGHDPARERRYPRPIRNN